MKKTVSLSVAISAALSISSFAQSVLDNFSFESNTKDPGSSAVAVAPGATTITGWNVLSPGVSYVGTALKASKGLRSVHLNLGTSGGVEQTFNSVPGQTYRVYVDASAYVGPTGGGAKLMTGSASALDGATVLATGQFSFDGTGKSFPNVGWATQFFDFTAASARTTIRIQSTTSGAYGPEIDNIRVVPGHDGGSGTWTIDGAPIFTTQMPASTKVAINTTAHFETLSQGAGPIAYQWYSQKGATTNLIAGQTGPSYDLANAPASIDGNRYFVVASNSLQKITNSTILSVISLPKFGSIETDVRVSANSTLSIGPNSFIGSVPDSFQWYKDGALLPGATSQTISKTAALTDAGVYYLIAHDVAGDTQSSNIVVQVFDGPVPPWLRAANTPPASLNVQEGFTLSLNIIAQGATPLSYFWYRDTTLIQSGSSQSFFKSGATLSDSGAYTVVVSNQAGTITTPATQVNIYPAQTAPHLAYSFTNVTAAVGANVSVTFPLTAGTFLNYQWSRGGVPIVGANTDTLTLSNVALTDSGSYAVAITNFVGSVLGSVNLTIVEKPRLGDLTSGYEGPEGGTASLSVPVLNFSSDLSYRWYRNGVLISGVSGQNYSFTVSAASAGDYTVVVTNAAGETTSGVMSVTIRAVTPSPHDFQLVADRTIPIPNRSGVNFNVLGGAKIRNGIVTFEGRSTFDESAGIYRWENGARTRTADATQFLPTFSALPTFMTAVSEEDSGSSFFLAGSTNNAPPTGSVLFEAHSGTLQMVANLLIPFPGKSGVTLGRIGYPTHSGTKTAFLVISDVENGAPAGGIRSIFVWDGSNLQKWVDSDAGLPAGDGIWAGNSAQVGFDGHTAAAWLVSQTTGDGIFATTDGGSLRKIAFKGDPIPGEAATFTGFVSPPHVENGKILFMGSGRLCEYADGVLRVLARPGQSVSGGGSYTSLFFNFGYDSDGSALFTASGPGDKSGVYRVRAGVITEELSSLNTLFGTRIQSVSLVDANTGDWLIGATLAGTNGNYGLYASLGAKSNAPTLSVTQSGAILHFSWGVSGQLQESADLAGWTSASPAGATAADVTIGSAGSRFYRVSTQ